MNKTNAHLYLPLVQALSEGKKIQKNIGTYLNENWEDSASPIFSSPPEFYRIKPEPRTIWVTEYDCGFCGVYEREEFAKRAADKECIAIVKFVEATDDV